MSSVQTEKIKVLDDIDLTALLDNILHVLDRTPIAVPMLKRGRGLVALLPFLLGILGFLVRLIPWEYAYETSYGILVFAGWSLLPLLIAFELKGFHKLVVLPNQRHLINAFMKKDRLGNPQPNSRLMRILFELSRQEEFSGHLLIGQPVDILERFLLERNQPLKNEALERLLIAIQEQDIAREKLVILSTQNVNKEVRQAACKRLGNTLSRDESEQFAISRYPEPRLFAIGQKTITRKRVVQLATQDQDSNVRLAACTRLGSTLSAEEAEQFATSNYSEHRLFAIGQKTITRKRVVQLATQDRDGNIRQAACKRLGNKLSAEESEQFATSTYPEHRLFAIGQKTITRKRVVQLAMQDRDGNIRQAACKRLGNKLSAEESEQFATSTYPEHRLFAIGQKTISRKQLVQLAIKDRDSNVRQAACNRLENPLSNEEREQLVNSHYPEVRLFVLISQNEITQAELIQLAIRDSNNDVRRTAIGRLGGALSSEGIQQLASSDYSDIRQVSVEQATDSAIKKELRSLFFNLCNDRDATVANLAFARLAKTIKEEEFELLQNVNNAIWEQIASHKEAPADMVAKLINQYIRRSKYVVDVREEGHHEYEYEDSYGQSYGEWVVDIPEQGHSEYDSRDIAQADRVINAVPERRELVLQYLRKINTELYDLLPK